MVRIPPMERSGVRRYINAPKGILPSVRVQPVSEDNFFLNKTKEKEQKKIQRRILNLWNGGR